MEVPAKIINSQIQKLDLHISFYSTFSRLPSITGYLKSCILSLNQVSALESHKLGPQKLRPSSFTFLNGLIYFLFIVGSSMRVIH